MKKLFPAVLAFALISSAITASALSNKASEQKGNVKFEAVKTAKGYEMTFSLTQEPPVSHKIMAVKITYLPSETVVYFLSDRSLSKTDEEDFLNGKTPAGKMAMEAVGADGNAKPDSSLVDPTGRIVIKYPSQISGDTSVKVEFLVQKDEDLLTMTVSQGQMPDNTNFGMRFYYSLR